MKLTTWILLLGCLHLSAKTVSQTMSISGTNLPLEKIFTEVKKQTGYLVFTSKQLLAKGKPVTLSVKNISVEALMQLVLKDQPFTYSIKDKTISIREKEPVAAPLPKATDPWPGLPVRVSGTIRGDNNQPLPGATVRIKGKNSSTLTDERGYFELMADPGSTLEITYVGFKLREHKVTGSEPLTIELVRVQSTLDTAEIVLNTGYQVIAKERATGSFVRVDNKKLNEQISTNFLGRLPAIANGLSVLPTRLTTNKPQLTIRGLSTVIGPREPLIVVDNFPYEGDINNINPNDIEEITILKDAAATSIWGTRAGNGVIVVVTKKGKFNEKLKIEVTANVTLTEKPDLFYTPDMSTSEYIDAEKFLFEKGYYDPSLNNNRIQWQSAVVDILEKHRKNEITSAEADAALNTLRNRDARKEYQQYAYQTGVNQQYAINLRGGSPVFAWVASGGFDKNEDPVKAGFNRYNFRIENTYKPTSKLQLTMAAQYANTETVNGMPEYNDGLPVYGNMPRYTQLVDDNGQQVPYQGYRKAFTDTIGGGRLLDWGYYPLEDYKHKTTKVRTQYILATIGLKYNLLKWLTIDLNYQAGKQDIRSEQLFGVQSFYTRDLINRFSRINYQTGQVTYGLPVGGIQELTQSEMVNQTLRSQLSIDHHWGRNSIAAVIGTETRDNKTQSNTNRYYGYNPDLQTFKAVDNFKQFPQLLDIWGTNTLPSIVRMRGTRIRFVSLYANATYTYDNRYSLSMSGRRDASNQFGVAANDKWTPLWSAGAAWNLSNERFYQSSAFPYLRFRATYGFSGNLAPGRSAITTIRYSGTSAYTFTPYALVANFRNENLTWEKVGQLNIGVDFRFKKSISGSIEYYRKVAKDLYGHAAYDRTLGLEVGTIQKNNGTMEGNGIDVSINSINIKRAFVWTTDLNFNYYQDKIVEFYMDQNNLYAGNYVGGAFMKGYPVYPVFSFKTAGLNPVTGAPQGYLHGKISTNYDGMVVDSATYLDLNYHGSADPKFRGSLANTFSWRGLSLTVNLMYQLGHYFVRSSINYGDLAETRNGHADFSKRWQQPGDEKFTTVPAMAYPAEYYREYFYQYSEPLVTRADHIRIQYINASYTLNKQSHPWIPFRSCRLSFVVNNVGLLWKANKEGIDPLYPDPQIPPSRNYSVGIQANL